MAGHAHHNPVDLTKSFALSEGDRRRLFITIAIGVVTVIIACVMLANHIGIGMHEAHGDGHGVAHAQVADHEGNNSRTGPHYGRAGSGEAPAAPAQEGIVAEGHTDPHGGEAHSPTVGRAGDQTTDGQAAAAHEGAGHHANATHDGEQDDHHGSPGWLKRLFANLWLNSVYFTGLAIAGVFFVAVNYVAQAGWSAGIKRIAEAQAGFLPVGLGLILLTFAVGHKDIFHWTHSDLYDPSLPTYDAILDGKRAYLNIPFFLIRTIGFVGLWIFLANLIRKAGLREDQEGGTVNHYKSVRYSAIFLVIFGVSSSMLAWDWCMSIEPHWFSTLFGWYMFASWWVAGLATLAYTTVRLMERGVVPHVNNSHIHNLGMFVFAFSIFWTYLWTAQYLLIFYANIPEEAIYYIERLQLFGNLYTPAFILNLFINFLFPFLMFMTRDAKRTMIIVKVVTLGVIAGHWVDFYLMVMPATAGAAGGFGLLEFGMLAIFIPIFILMYSRMLASAPLVQKNHPMMVESVAHEI